MQKYYVPLLVQGREKSDNVAKTYGIFSSEKSAVDVLITILVEDCYIDYDSYLEDYEIIESDIRDNELDMEEYFEKWEIEDIYRKPKCTSVTEYIDLLKSTIMTEKDLIKYCHKDANSFYNDDWNFQIDIHEISP